MSGSKFKKRKRKLVGKIVHNLLKRKRELEWLQSIDGRIHLKEIGEYNDQQVIKIQMEYSKLLENLSYWEKVFERTKT